MATIGVGELDKGMRELQQNIRPNPTTWSKPEIKAAFQSLEDWFEDPPSSAKVDAGAAIEVAAPGVFTNAQKKKIGGVWMLRKALRDLL